MLPEAIVRGRQPSSLYAVLRPEKLIITRFQQAFQAMTETLAQVLCNEAGVPVHEMMDDDVAARELTLDTKMRAFFRLSAFSHRCAASASILASPLRCSVGSSRAAASVQRHCVVRGNAAKGVSRQCVKLLDFSRTIVSGCTADRKQVSCPPGRVQTKLCCALSLHVSLQAAACILTRSPTGCTERSAKLTSKAAQQHPQAA